MAFFPANANAAVSIVLPCYGEVEALRKFLPMLQAFLPEVEVLVVWDGPDDGTKELCWQQGVVPFRGEGKGLGAAILTGIRCATYDLVIVMDGDGQHPINPLRHMIDALRDGSPFVAGRRIDSVQMPWQRQLMSQLCTALVRPLTPLLDPMTGFFGINRQEVELGNLNSQTWKIGMEIAVKSKLPFITYVDYIFQTRAAGKSKAGIVPALQFLEQVIRLYAWKIDLQQMLRFGVVGSSGVLVNMGVTIGLVEWGSVDYRAAAIIGIGIAMQWNYLWNKFWTFRRKREVANSTMPALADK